MKQYQYLYILLITIFLYACAQEYTLDYRTEVAVPKAKEIALRELLAGAENGWKLTILPQQSSTPVDFYFTFNKKGLAQSNSDFIKMANNALYEITDNKDSLVLKIVGSHFKYLDVVDQMNLFLVSNSSSDKIDAKNLETGKNVEFVKATTAELEALIAKKAESEKFMKYISENEFTTGVIRKNDEFEARYRLNFDNDMITISYIESDDNYLHHVSKKITYQGASVEWDDISFNGLTLHALSLENNAIVLGGKNVDKLLLQNNTIADRFLKKGNQYEIGKSMEHVEASPDVWKNIEWSNLYSIELNYDWATYDLVAITYEWRDNAWKWGWLFHQALENAEAAILTDHIDKVTWKFYKLNNYGASDNILNASQTELAHLKSFYFNDNGMYIVKETDDDNWEKGSLYYLLSTTEKQWIKVCKK